MKYYKFRRNMPSWTQMQYDDWSRVGENAISHKYPIGTIVLVLESRVSKKLSYDDLDYVNLLALTECGIAYFNRVHTSDYEEL